jgi:hypothetical protein
VAADALFNDGVMLSGQMYCAFKVLCECLNPSEMILKTCYASLWTLLESA